jgi:integration host factor subunit beta
MNKMDLIKALNDEFDIPKIKAARIVSAFFDKMANALANGGRVEIRGLFSFYVKQYEPYTGRNPKTGEVVEIKPKKLPYFKCGKGLKERINN